LNSKYELKALLGDGTFGRVLLAIDKPKNCNVAVKIIRDEERYRNDAKFEAAILRKIRRADPAGTSGCAIMHEAFMHDERFFCLVFEQLGASLYDFLKANYFQGFWMQDIQCIAQQCMQALAFLHGQLRMIHTDLKPENILLLSVDPPRAAHFTRGALWKRNRELRQDPSSSSPPPSTYMRPAAPVRIKLVDFGNTHCECEARSPVINTRQYRSPEVLLQLGWDEMSDIWSVGCILMELYLGEQLFEAHDDLEHLALLEKILGALPQDMFARTGLGVREKCLAEAPAAPGRWSLRWPEKAQSNLSKRLVAVQLPLLEQVLPQHLLLAEFVGALLRLEPERRPRSINALLHPFLTAKLED